MPSSSVTPDPRAGEPSLLGKRIAPRPLFCPVASAPHAALHWGQGAGPGDHLRQMWTHSTFCRARGALKMFRSLLGPWLGTTTGKNNGEPLVYVENRRRWRYAWARNAACSRFASSRHRSQ